MRAMLALEGQARALGLTSLARHVLGHNRAVHALYARPGHELTNINMTPQLV